MEPLTPDWYTVWGFWIGVAGFVLGGIGLVVTFRQALKARRAADAAREAAEQTRRESEASFRNFLSGVVHRHLADAERFVICEEWEFARFRCEDMAALFGQLADAATATEYRTFANFFRDKLASPRKRFPQTNWDALIILTKNKLDAVSSPFRKEQVT